MKTNYTYFVRLYDICGNVYNQFVTLQSNKLFDTNNINKYADLAIKKYAQMLNLDDYIVICSSYVGGTSGNECLKGLDYTGMEID